MIDKRLILKFILILIAAFGLAGPALAQHGSADDPVVEMQTVTVTAEKISEYIQNHPQQVTVMDRKEIQERNFLTVEETLNSMPGVEVRQSAGIGSRISIRGSGKSSGVLVLLNGRPLNSSQYGGADLSGIPIDIVQSVTVFKPPVPVWLGPGASDGAISIVIHDFPEADGKNEPINSMKLSAGSYGLADASISRRMPTDDGSVMLTAAGQHRDGKRVNSDKNNGTFSLHWDQESSDSAGYEINGRCYLSEYGTPGPTDNPTPDARQQYQKGSLDTRVKGFLGETGDYSLNVYGDVVALEDKSQSGFTSTLDDLKYGVKGETNWAEANDVWALRLSGELNQEDADHTVTGEHRRTVAGIGSQLDRAFGDLTATVGVRGDHASDFGLNPGGSAGLSYALSEKLLLKANAGYSVNLPTFDQLYQPSHGSYDQVRGNPDLLEEKIGSYDLGFEFKIRKDRVFQASLFRADTNDLIVYDRGEDLIYRPVNIDNAYRQGIEITLKYAWDMGLSADANCIFQDSENRDTGKQLSYTPRIQLKTTLKYTLPRLDARLETTIRYEGERFSEPENLESQRLDDYIAVDAKAIQPFKIKQIPAEWFVQIENLFDAEFEIHQGYPDDGIRFTTGVNLTF